jgi:hypothetical protein
MGIEKKPLYIAVCDGCQQYYRSPEGGAQCFDEMPGCLETVVADGWMLDGHWLYCPGCHGGGGVVN